MNIYAFKRKIKYFAILHELRIKDQYKLLMNGTIITKDALDVMQNNITMINPWFYNENTNNITDDNYHQMVKRIWNLLESHYGHKDKVMFYTNRLKQFKQRNFKQCNIYQN